MLSATDPGPSRWLPDARLAVIATFLALVGIVATPPGAWHLVAAEGLLIAFLWGLSGVEVGSLLRRVLALSLLVGFLALLLAPGHPARSQLGLVGVVAALVARNALAILTLLLLAGTYGAPRLLDALSRLGLPAPVVTTLHFMQRYGHVLIEELTRMSHARRARHFGRAGLLDGFWLAGMLGALLVRSLERGDRIHAAMLARGWDGTHRSLEGRDS